MEFEIVEFFSGKYGVRCRAWWWFPGVFRYLDIRDIKYDGITRWRARSEFKNDQETESYQEAAGLRDYLISTRNNKDTGKVVG